MAMAMLWLVPCLSLRAKAVLALASWAENDFLHCCPSIIYNWAFLQIQHGCHSQLDAASLSKMDAAPIWTESLPTWPHWSRRAALLSLPVWPPGWFKRLTWQATQGWPDRSISLAFLSSSQVWELTILNKINDLISLIQSPVGNKTDLLADISSIHNTQKY